MLCSRGPIGLIALPFTHGPMFVSLVLAHFLNSPKAQATFILSSFLGSSRILVGRYGRSQIEFSAVEQDTGAVVFELAEAFGG